MGASTPSRSQWAAACSGSSRRSCVSLKRSSAVSSSSSRGAWRQCACRRFAQRVTQLVGSVGVMVRKGLTVSVYSISQATARQEGSLLHRCATNGVPNWGCPGGSNVGSFPFTRSKIMSRRVLWGSFLLLLPGEESVWGLAATKGIPWKRSTSGDGLGGDSAVRRTSCPRSGLDTLTDTAIRQAAPGSKPVHLFDGRGCPWRFRPRAAGGGA